MTSSDFVSINKSPHNEKMGLVFCQYETNLVTDNKLTRTVRNPGVPTVSALHKQQEDKEEETPEGTDKCENRKMEREKR